MKFVNHIEPVAPRRAGGAVAEVYAEARREFGRLPEPLAMLSPDEGLLTAGWATLRETLLVGQVPRGRKEAVAAAVAASLRCPWCVDAHTTMLYAAGQTDTAAAILAGTAPAAGDPNAPYVAWAAGTGTPAGPPAPFGPDVAAEYLGTAVQFHFIARLVLVLLDETFLPGGPRAQQLMRRAGGLVFARKVRAEHRPGRSTRRLEPRTLRRSGMGNTVRAHSNRVRRAQPPPGHRAAPAATDSSGGQAGRGVVARRANADEQSLDERAHRRAAADLHAPPTRQVVRRVVGSWHGEPMPMSSRWTNEHTAELAVEDMSSSSQQGLTTPANPNPRPGPCRHHPAKRCSAPPVRAPHDPTPPAQPPTTQQPQPSMQLTRPHHGPNYGARSSAIQQHQNHTIRTALAPRNGPHDAHDGHLNYPRLCS